jgi:hypothetical protein
MSRGPGRVERILIAKLERDPLHAFSVDELCRYAFPRSRQRLKKHRVSVIRAVKNVTRHRLTGWRIDRIEARGQPMVVRRRAVRRAR